MAAHLTPSPSPETKSMFQERGLGVRCEQLLLFTEYCSLMLSASMLLRTVRASGLCLMLCIGVSACGAAAAPTPTAEPLFGTPAVAPTARASTIAPTQTVTPPPIVAAILPTPSLIMPPCAPGVETPLKPPPTFPTNFPLPPGLLIYRSGVLQNNPAYPQSQIVAIAPLSVAESARHLRAELPKVGYEILQTDGEEGEDEATFRGNGWRGSWRINGVQGCLGATKWVVQLTRL